MKKQKGIAVRLATVKEILHNWAWLSVVAQYGDDLAFLARANVNAQYAKEKQEKVNTEIIKIESNMNDMDLIHCETSLCVPCSDERIKGKIVLMARDLELQKLHKLRSQSNETGNWKRHWLGAADRAKARLRKMHESMSGETFLVDNGDRVCLPLGCLWNEYKHELPVRPYDGTFLYRGTILGPPAGLVSSAPSVTVLPPATDVAPK